MQLVPLRHASTVLSQAVAHWAVAIGPEHTGCRIRRHYTCWAYVPSLDRSMPASSFWRRRLIMLGDYRGYGAFVPTRIRLGRFDRMNIEGKVEPVPHGTEDGGKVVHTRIPPRRQHAMQALARLLCDLGELLESDRGVDKIAKNEPCSFRFAAQKQGCRFIEKRLGKLRIALNTLNDGLLEVAGQCHTITFSLSLPWPRSSSVPCIWRAMPWPGRYFLADHVSCHHQTE